MTNITAQVNTLYMQSIEFTDIEYAPHTELPRTVNDIEVAEANTEWTHYLNDQGDHFNLELQNAHIGAPHIDIKPTKLENCVLAMHNIYYGATQHLIFPNTEFYVQYTVPSNTLLISVGESWCYGGKVRDMNNQAYTETALSMSHAVHRTVSAQCAKQLGADLYQYAYPGNCNYAMLYWLEQNLPWLTNMNYDQVYVLLQFTDQNRELGADKGISALCGDDYEHQLQLLRKPVTRSAHWFTEYTQWYEHRLNTLLSKHPDVNTLLWGNFFVPQNFSHSEQNLFTVYHQSWCELCAQLEGTQLPSAPTANSIIYDTINCVSESEPAVQLQSQLTEYWEHSTLCASSYPAMCAHTLWSNQLSTQLTGRNSTFRSANFLEQP